MPNPRIPITFIDVVRNPYTYLLITVVSLLWYFVYANTRITTKKDTDCQQTNTELRMENKKLQGDKDALYNALLVKNGVIDKLTVKTDSLSTQKEDEN